MKKQKNNYSFCCGDIKEKSKKPKSQSQNGWLAKFKARQEKYYKVECKRNGTRLLDLEVYKEHKKQQWINALLILLFIWLFTILIVAVMELDHLQEKILDDEVRRNTPSNYTDGCVDMFNKLAGDNFAQTIAINGITRQDCFKMEARK